MALTVLLVVLFGIIITKHSSSPLAPAYILRATMSSPFVSKKHAVSSAEAGSKDGGADDGPSSRHKRMRLEPEVIKDDDDQKPSADPHRDLDLAFERRAQALIDIEAATLRLEVSEDDIEKARQDIRARGEAEFDSLLVVGNDSVSHILCYVDVKQLCLCEMTCKAFHRLSGGGWKALDKMTGPNKSTVDSPKSRCVRYVRASEYAQKMERHASSHRWGDHEAAYEDSGYSDPLLLGSCDVFKHEVDDGFPNAVCDFPDELATLDKSEKEVFLRISNISGENMMEGFFPLRTLEGGLRGGKRCLDLCSANCPNWPEMEAFLSRQRFENDERKSWWDGQDSSLQLLLLESSIVTLVALNKFNVPRLVASVHEFVLVVYPKDDPWLPTVLGENPMKPHYFGRYEYVKSRGIEFGWCKKRDVIGFCLVDTMQNF